MAKTLTSLKDEARIHIRDKTDGTVESDDLTVCFNSAISTLKTKSEFPGTKQRAEFDIFDTVYEYPAPSGYKAMIDFRSPGDLADFERRSSKEFWHDINQASDIWADDNYNEQKLLLVRRGSLASLILHDCDSVTSNGTWVVDAGTDASNLTTDEGEVQQGGGALNFDVSGATTTAAIQNLALSTTVDLTDHENKSTLFARVDLPDVTNITSLTLRWGSSSSDYWSATVTAQYSGLTFKNGWNRVGFAWNGATETGTADASAISYLRYQITYADGQVADTDFRLDDIRSCLPERLIANYYSTNFVKTSAGVYQAEFESDDDVSVLEAHEDKILLWAALEEIFGVLRDDSDAEKARTKWLELFSVFADDKPDEEEAITDSYYWL